MIEIRDASSYEQFKLKAACQIISDSYCIIAMNNEVDQLFGLYRSNLVHRSNRIEFVVNCMKFGNKTRTIFRLYCIVFQERQIVEKQSIHKRPVNSQ